MLQIWPGGLTSYRKTKCGYARQTLLVTINRHKRGSQRNPGYTMQPSAHQGGHCYLMPSPRCAEGYTSFSPRTMDKQSQNKRMADIYATSQVTVHPLAHLSGSDLTVARMGCANNKGQFKNVSTIHFLCFLHSNVQN